MGESKWAFDHSYRIVMAADGTRAEQILEFDAPGSDVALFRVQKHCLGRDLEMFEDGRSLGHLRWHARGGFWVLTPPKAPFSHAARVLSPCLMAEEASG